MKKYWVAPQSTGVLTNPGEGLELLLYSVTRIMSTPGVSNTQPAGHLRPANDISVALTFKHFYNQYFPKT